MADALTNLGFYRTRPVPKELEGLAELALDMRWSWNHSADELWRTIDPELWEAAQNPWLILVSVSEARLQSLAADRIFLNELDRQLAFRREHLEGSTWFSEKHGRGDLGTVAYFSMEFGLSEALPIYSGGLGILAGDHLKTASDLGVPVIGVGLLYPQGYFRQSVDSGGEQLEFYPYNEPMMLPVAPLRTATGEWLRIAVELPGRVLQLRTWQVRVGRTALYLLDSNDPCNGPGDRAIVGELYGGGAQARLQQEIVLGIGGVRLLDALGIDARVLHLNEGHTALAVLERARIFMRRSGRPFGAALCATRVGNVFTTHTPVAAGFDRFEPGLFGQYFEAYAAELGLTLGELLALGQADPGDAREPFNMAYLALRGSGMVNGVSRLHGQVGRRLFGSLFAHWPEREVPVGHVTNGVHVPSWDSAAADEIWTRVCGKTRWLGELEKIADRVCGLDDGALWEFKCRERRALVSSIVARVTRERAHRGDAAVPGQCPCALDANSLTLGFARRFTAYKRPDLLLHDPSRLTRLLTHPRFPAQLVVAGKAHPEDAEGKRMVREWTNYMRTPEVCCRAVFLEDYDMELAAELVQGVDVWIGTPLRPWEACGTSGMKVLVNGGLNLSVLDGWWAEAYSPEVGWALEDAAEYEDEAARDRADAEALYALLEDEVIPAFYDRDSSRIPRRWVARMRASMTTLTPRFSSNRMVREYTEEFYLPCAAALAKRMADNGKLGAELYGWIEAFKRNWDGVHFGTLEVRESDGHYLFEAQAHLGGLDPADARVELYAESANGARPPQRVAMARGERLSGAVNGHVYRASLPAIRPSVDYTPRIIPNHPDIAVPLEVNRIFWER